jgi:glycerate kinase
LAVFAGATLQPGFEVVAKMINAESRIQAAEVVITGEGRLDTQTLSGKGPAGIATLARKYRKRVFAIVGESVQHRGKEVEIFDEIRQLSALASTKAESMTMARELLRKCARDMAKSW